MGSAAATADTHPPPGERTAGKDERRLAKKDLVGAVDHRLEPRAAEAVDGQGRRWHRHARVEADVAGQVDGVRRRLADVAKDDRVHITGRGAIWWPCARSIER